MRTILSHLTLAYVLVLLAPASARTDEQPTRLAPTTDDMAVPRAARLEPGTHRVVDANGNGALHITQDGTVLDLQDAALLGAADGSPAHAYQGVGIRVEGARGVVIRGGVIRGYKIAIQAVDAPDLVIEDVDASENWRQRLGSTPAREDPSDWLWPHENDAGEWETRYGAGFSLTRCSGAQVRRCRVQHGQNGLLLTRSDGARVHACDFSFNSGWGIALYRTSRAVLTGNACDFCVRGYSHGVYHRGQDSAGILLFEQSSDNILVGNSATHSGDGLFLYAGHETTQRTGEGGCDRNVVHDNDFSYAVANGIEATFSRDNVFVNNRIDGCDHGIWAGYSARTIIAGNRGRDCLSAGISIEHGQENRIIHNVIAGGRYGVHLWWDADEAFVQGVLGKARDTSSARNVLYGNDLLGSAVAVRLAGDTETELRWNVLQGTEALLELDAGARPGAIEHNLFRGPRSPAGQVPILVRGADAAAWKPTAGNQRRGPIEVPAGFDASRLEEVLRLVRPPTRLPERPDIPGACPPPSQEDRPRGREQIRIDENGPLDPSLPAVFPRTVRGTGTGATVELLGLGAWRVVATRGAVSASPSAGTLPGRLAVRANPDSTHALHTFELDVELAGRLHTVRGRLLAATWTLVHFPLAGDPRTEPAAFAAAAQAARADPARRLTVPALDFAWQTGGPAGGPADHFGTWAETTLQLPAGRYRLRTVSDDGVRVSVGEREVIARWTHHAPTEDSVELQLEAGAHRLRVEHFELDGWAHLTFDIEKLD
ncbi:MAG: right-handed parallel beta-helix repeat-containing protein [Planctomycetota bacterium]|nr:right-handed parallel beta-helix repeat-containing protein [Planctomycetota bacterium]